MMTTEKSQLADFLGLCFTIMRKIIKKQSASWRDFRGQS